jgi:hypothetical protein
MKIAWLAPYPINPLIPELRTSKNVSGQGKGSALDTGQIRRQHPLSRIERG